MKHHHKKPNKPKKARLSLSKDTPSEKRKNQQKKNFSNKTSKELEERETDSEESCHSEVNYSSSLSAHDDEEEEEELDSMQSNCDELESEGYSTLDNKNEPGAYDDSHRNETTNQHKTSRVDSRKAAKTLLQERKRNREHGSLIQDAKALWESCKMSAASGNKQQKEEVYTNLYQVITGHVKDMIFKHDASRIIQFCIKEGKNHHRESILKELEGSIIALSYVTIARGVVRKELIEGRLKKLVLHREASYVVEEVYNYYSLGKEKEMMLEALYGPEYLLYKKDSTLPVSIYKNSLEIIQSSIHKGTFGYSTILHSLSLALIEKGPNEKNPHEELLELLKDQFIHILHTQQGSSVVKLLLPYANIKTRKTLVKECKTPLLSIMKDSWGYKVLMTLLYLTDDTVLIKKIFIQELEAANISELVKDKKSSLILLYMVSGRFLGKDQENEFEALLKKSQELGHTKKDTSTKKEELCNIVKESLSHFFLSIDNFNRFMDALDSYQTSCMLKECLFHFELDFMNSFVLNMAKTFNRDNLSQASESSLDSMKRFIGPFLNECSNKPEIYKASEFKSVLSNVTAICQSFLSALSLTKHSSFLIKFIYYITVLVDIDKKKQAHYVEEKFLKNNKEFKKELLTALEMKNHIEAKHRDKTTQKPIVKTTPEPIPSQYLYDLLFSS